MKKHMITAALVAVMALGLGTVAGCSQEAPREDVNANVPAGAPPLMPTSHDGRFENLGAAGCYGCHGANDQANPMLADATALPADHYASGFIGIEGVTGINLVYANFEDDPTLAEAGTR